MSYEIIDFHTHPFTDEHNNICNHIEYCNMSPENTLTYLTGLGISRICGTVICRNTAEYAPYENEWEMIKASNETALSLKKMYGDFYIPGFHVHPGYVKESCEEIERMNNLGIHLLGELVPYMHGWSDYAGKNFDEILDAATEYHMVVSVHTGDDDQMDVMVRKHPNTVIVAAHPGEAPGFTRHLSRMRMSGNYYLDLAGTGLFRHGMLRHGIDEYGAERFLFGSDYPICNPGMFLGGVLLDTLITEKERTMILAGNAKRLLGLE